MVALFVAMALVLPWSPIVSIFHRSSVDPILRRPHPPSSESSAHIPLERGGATASSFLGGLGCRRLRPHPSEEGRRA
ncbi:hypothetical protein M413DRAFT_449234 [Hebeloma cylindrosporum]|uniref:Secreted protein n=1 Tax=Hebeloma cylindrosporum TaxID=76867 RepID=A0A0C2Y5M4_HEBCY|nr:hypothetical protein M413DRAFT_449234 [Hebeloma cylindrosporum h7]